MLSILRVHLRKNDWTILRISSELGVGEATVKRWLAGKGLTIERLERLSRLCGLGLGDLAREAEDSRGDLAHELTLAQERALADNTFLSFLFMTILNGIQPQETSAELNIPAQTMEAALARLERLALINRLKSGRVSPLVDRSMVFRKFPLRSLFEKHMKNLFFELDYGAPDTVYTAEVVKLSHKGTAQLAELLEQFRSEVQALADRDRQVGGSPRHWNAVLFVMRELELSPMRSVALQSPL